MTRNRPRPEHARGQTLNDFAIGMAIFLLVLGYVFAFTPSLFAPFTPQTDSTTIRADRTADYLTRDALAENTSAPGRLNETCTEAFFAKSNSCGFGSSTIGDITGLPPRTDVNVTMRRNDGIATHGGTRLARGPRMRNAGPQVTRSVRIVSLNEIDYRFEVRIW